MLVRFIDRKEPSRATEAAPPLSRYREGLSGTNIRDGTIAPRDRVLLLEGDGSSRLALGAILQEAGYEVTSSGSCHDGLRLAQETRPYVVVLDEALAGLACGDVLAELKSASSTAGVKAILLVSGGAPERVRALDLGADDVLSRPFEPFEHGRPPPCGLRPR